MTGILWSLGISLGLTLLVELGLALVLGIRKPKDLLLVGLVNVLTNPVVVIICNLTLLLTHTSPPWYLIGLLEITAVGVEGVLYRSRLEYCRIHPFLLSLILNATSYFGGLLL